MFDFSSPSLSISPLVRAVVVLCPRVPSIMTMLPAAQRVIQQLRGDFALDVIIGTGIAGQGIIGATGRLATIPVGADRSTWKRSGSGRRFSGQNIPTPPRA